MLRGCGKSMGERFWVASALHRLTISTSPGAGLHDVR
jgi:hypothetical protein